MSFWSRFWRLLGPFWPPFWGRFRPFWRPSSAKFGPKPVLKACQLQKRDFSPNTRPRVPERHIGAQDDTQNAPRSAQDGSKRLLKSIFSLLKIVLIFDSFWMRFWSILAPKSLPKKVGGAPPFSILKSFVFHVMLCIASRGPKSRPRGPKTSQEHP